MSAGDRFNNDLRCRSSDHSRNRLLTPPYILEPVRAALGGEIGLDPCTEVDNPTAALMFYTAQDDGLSQPWSFRPISNPSIFCNPPYGKAREPWVENCISAGELGQRVILLIPSHTDTRIFQKVMDSATSICFIKGRVKFGTLRPNRRQEAASHPSALIGWNIERATLSPLGKCVSP